MRDRKPMPFYLLIIGIAVLCIAAIIIFVLINAGTLDQSSEPFDKDQKRIAFVSPQVNYPVWLQAKKGFDDAAEEFGFYGLWLGGGNCNIDDMVKEIDVAISENVDAVITCPLTPDRFTPIFEKLQREGIPLITIAVDAEQESLRSAFVGSNYTELGYKQAEALHENVGNDMKIGVIMSGLETQNQVIQVESLKEYIKDLPNAEIIAYDEDFSDPVIGISVFSDMIDAHPEINAIFGTEGGGPSGFAKVVKDHGLQDQITIIGMDIIEDNLNVIREGNIYGVMSQDFYQMGFLAGQYALEKSTGQEVPSITYTKTELITNDNVDTVESVGF